jgi:hypothetical protein
MQPAGQFSQGQVVSFVQPTLHVGTASGIDLHWAARLFPVAFQPPSAAIQPQQLLDKMTDSRKRTGLRLPVTPRRARRPIRLYAANCDSGCECPYEIRKVACRAMRAQDRAVYDRVVYCAEPVAQECKITLHSHVAGAF